MFESATWYRIHCYYSLAPYLIPLTLRPPLPLPNIHKDRLFRHILHFFIRIWVQISSETKLLIIKSITFEETILHRRKISKNFLKPLQTPSTSASTPFQSPKVIKIHPINPNKPDKFLHTPATITKFIS